MDGFWPWLDPGSAGPGGSQSALPSTISSTSFDIDFLMHLAWHLGMDFPGTKGKRDWSEPTKDMPLDKGFDYFWGIPASMNYGVLAWFDGRHPITAPDLYTRKKPNKIALSDYSIKSPYEE